MFVLLFAVVVRTGRATPPAAKPKPVIDLKEYRRRRALWRAAVRELVLQSQALADRANEWESDLEVDDIRRLVSQATGNMRRSGQQVWNMEPTTEAAEARRFAPIVWGDAMAWLDQAKSRLRLAGQWADDVDQDELPLDHAAADGDRKGWRKVMMHWGDLVCLWNVDFLMRKKACDQLEKVGKHLTDYGGSIAIADGLLKDTVAGGFPIYGPPPEAP